MFSNLHFFSLKLNPVVLLLLMIWGFFVGFFFFESLCALEDECLLVLNVIVLYNLLLVTM